MNTTKYQRRYEKRKAAGKCVKCGGPRDNSASLTCWKCYYRQKNRDKNKLNNGICLCGAAINKGRSCQNCKNQNKEYARRVFKERQEKGLCYECDLPPLSNRMNCEEHTIKNIASSNCGSRDKWIIIQELLIQQNNKCKYCKDNIQLANNAELDHIKSKLRFPELKGEPTNWQWLCTICNRAKNDMTEDEFFTWVKRFLEGI